MEKLNPKAVIFDLGSTLIEYESVSWDELSIMCNANTYDFLQKQGYKLPEKQQYIDLFELAKKKYREEAARSYREWTLHQAIVDLLKELEIEPEDGLVDQIFSASYMPVDKQLYVYDDTIETLQKLRQAVPVIGLLSNTIFPERVHIEELHRFRIDSFFDFKIFSSTFGVRKPHAEIFYHAANLAGYAPGECVYVGDRYLEDVEGPTKIGMAAILKYKGGREYPDEMPQAQRVIHHLAELPAHLTF